MSVEMGCIESCMPGDPRFNRTDGPFIAVPGFRPAPGTDIKAPDLNLIVRSLAETRQRDSGRLRPRKVAREYKIFRHGDKEPVSQVTAEIRFVSQGKSKYEITHASGSFKGEKVVRKILYREIQPTKKEHYSEISDQN